jgi:hypothetical protein
VRHVHACLRRFVCGDSSAGSSGSHQVVGKEGFEQEEEEAFFAKLEVLTCCPCSREEASD